MEICFEKSENFSPIVQNSSEIKGYNMTIYTHIRFSPKKVNKKN